MQILRIVLAMSVVCFLAIISTKAIASASNGYSFNSSGVDYTSQKLHRPKHRSVKRTASPITQK